MVHIKLESISLCSNKVKIHADGAVAQDYRLQTPTNGVSHTLSSVLFPSSCIAASFTPHRGSRNSIGSSVT